MYIDIAPFLV